MRIGCPKCRTDVSLDEQLQSTKCPQCEQWLHAIKCTSCSHAFISLGAWSETCPRCANAVHFAAAVRTFGDTLDSASGIALVVERQPPIMRVRHDEDADAHVAPRLLAELFAVLALLALVGGVTTATIVDGHLAGFPTQAAR